MKALILISGKMQTGKDTVGNFIYECLPNHNYIPKLYALADDLKIMCQESFTKINTMYNLTVENWWDKKTTLTRAILQNVGTELVKGHIDEDFWAKRLGNKINKDYDICDFDVPIITDVRFVNEIECLQKWAYEWNIPLYLIRVDGETDENEVITEHVSENDLDGWEGWSYIILNDKSNGIDALKEQCKILVADIVEDINANV